VGLEFGNESEGMVFTMRCSSRCSGLAFIGVLLASATLEAQVHPLPPVNFKPVAQQAMQPPGQGEILWFGQDEPPLLVQPGQSVLQGEQLYLPGGEAPHGNQWGAAPRDRWHWQWLPDGLMYPNYLASGRESRLGTVLAYERDHGWLWDSALGAHVGILRFGDTYSALPYGWQIDLEGAAFPRLDLESERELISVDFRAGVPLTIRQGPFEAKLAYYHISSHLGDDYIFDHPGELPVDYVRDAVVGAVGLRLVDRLRVYAEAGYAFCRKGGSKPWEFQFGVDYSRVEPDAPLGSPFFAVNGQIREEVDFGGNLTAQAGWQWRGDGGHLLRVGFHYFNGKTDAYQFYTEHEEAYGLGLWYDF
jgi:hypothetical protein